jgi:Zn-dependent peptidase ImmA (M78 family)
VETAAKALEWPEERLVEVERSVEIALEDLERLAKKYRLPKPTLLMPEPLPGERYPPRVIDDFRLHADAQQEPLTLATRIRVENAYELIDLMSEVNDADEEVAPRPNLPGYHLGDDAERAAANERGRIAPALDEQLAWDAPKDAFLHWREVIEAEEVVVHKVPFQEESVRGFALYKNGYGLIAVDSNDDYRPRVFTLFHEYAHLLLRASGISDQNRQVPIERWCNRFAATFLMPRDCFLREYRLLFPEGGPPSEWQVSRMSVRFQVSKSAVAIRFEELGLAAAGFYDRLKAEWQQRGRKRGGGGGNTDQIDVELGRFGTTHVSVVNEALGRGIIDRIEAQYALDVPHEHFPALMAAARKRHQAYGPAR